MNLIKPTVGRKVWYRPSLYDLAGPVPMSISGSVAAGNAQPLDATVLAVWGDRCINVQVLDITGKAFTKMSVTLKQEGDTMPVDSEGKEVLGYCEWMPYQQSAAKKDACES
ncbi:hypothetical protein HNQ51_001747 [Inhella inkyongensis]|uniref:Uncharacterized protein n=1 Tax=Inhella inkyongensis TaxID=392593 RepID=A0A840S3Y6_9BURK|nr:hypothetical protein [Inhella inkyongensis]MBB5204433.1 hypothetical protein [Inhella inkyongensis]